MKNKTVSKLTFADLPAARRTLLTIELACACLLLLLLPIYAGGMKYAMNDLAVYVSGGYELIPNGTPFSEAVLPCIPPILLDCAVIALSVAAYAKLRRGTTARCAAVLYGVTALAAAALIVCTAVLWNKEANGTVPNPFRLAEYVPFRYDLTPQNEFGDFLRRLIGGNPLGAGWWRLYAYKYIPMAGTLVLSVVGCLPVSRKKSARA
ncbi:MAG: hypothetical protein MJ192_08390 [Clostridia bacterium]|nr:hypothetical protein [Clostridia bacterium]